MDHYIQKILRIHKQGEPAGIYSVCSANPFVLEAALQQAKKDQSMLLVEATSNQVDQYGGYTGMTPAAFVDFVRDIANKMAYPFDRVILGGDHLGPNVWQNEPAESAMVKAREQIQTYIAAGFSKIHLDTSMRCADDPGHLHDPLDARTVAQRAADLCAVAEKAFTGQTVSEIAPVYIIGTEVPIPGGAQEALGALHPSSVEDTRLTIELTRQAFAERGLDAAWARVIAVVVQPGVEFGDASVIDYDRKKAEELTHLIEEYPNLVYEAHSTDYQTRRALSDLVEDHFAILKVGPWLTFALREAVFALADIETEWLSGRKSVQLSNIKEVIEGVMHAQPQYWQKHYRGSNSEMAFARKYSYSDRIRYYWPSKSISRVLDHLISNLTAHPAPLNLLSQYLPFQHQAVRSGKIPNIPRALIHHSILAVTENYARATRMNRTEAIYESL